MRNRGTPRSPCPDCHKFTGLENGDPEIENIEAEFNGECGFNVTGYGRAMRNCADCGTTMKEITIDLEDEVPLKGFDWKKANKPFEPDLEQVVKQLNEGSGSVNIENDDPVVNEAGGGRYKRNMIEIVVPYSITIQLDDDVEGVYSADIKVANPASAYEECC